MAKIGLADLGSALNGEGEVGGRQKQRRETGKGEGEQVKGGNRQSRRSEEQAENHAKAAALLSGGVKVDSNPPDLSDIPLHPSQRPPKQTAHRVPEEIQPKGVTQMNTTKKDRPKDFEILLSILEAPSSAEANTVALKAVEAFGREMQDRRPGHEGKTYRSLRIVPLRDHEASGRRKESVGVSLYITKRHLPKRGERAKVMFGELDENVGEHHELNAYANFAEDKSKERRRPDVDIALIWDAFNRPDDIEGAIANRKSFRFNEADPDIKMGMEFTMAVKDGLLPPPVRALKTLFAVKLAKDMYVANRARMHERAKKAERNAALAERDQMVAAAMAEAGDSLFEVDLSALAGDGKPAREAKKVEQVREPKGKRPPVPAEYDRKSLVLLRHGSETDLMAHLATLADQTARIILIDWDASNAAGSVVGVAARLSLGDGAIMVQSLGNIEGGGKYAGHFAGTSDDAVTVASAIIAAANGNPVEGDEYAKLFGAALAAGNGPKRERREAVEVAMPALAVDQAVRDEQALSAVTLETVVAGAEAGDVEEGGEDAEGSADDRLVLASSAGEVA